MGVGMGIGAFAEGLASGLALGDSIQKSMDERKLKENLASARKEATDKFGPDLNDEGYSYMMKKSASAMMEAGRTDDAYKFLKWSEEADTKHNTKQFAAGLRQIDMGDLEGFDKTLGKLGKAKGYGPDVGVGFARGDDGKIITNKTPDGQTFYRLKVTPPGATEPVLQDVPAARLKDVYARWFNPQTAYEAERAQTADKSKRDADITDYERKKQIDSKYADPDKAKKERVEAIDSLRKRDANGKSFDDMADAEKEAAIKKEIELRRGAPAGPAAQGLAPVIMDKATGQPVKQPTAPGLSRAGQPAPASQAQGLGAGAMTRPAAQPASPNAPLMPDEIAALEAEGTAIDNRISDTLARSRSPEAAETLIGPMRAARADLDNRIRLAKEQRGVATASPAAGQPPPDLARRSVELDDINRQLGELRNRQGGAGYGESIASLEARRGALLEELNAARRAWR